MYGWMTIIALSFWSFIIANVQAQPIYRWEDHNGTIHYSQQPPQQQFSQRRDNDLPIHVPQPFSSDTHQESAAFPFSHGLLWKIEKAAPEGKSYPPSYLFGTIHSEDPRVALLPKAVDEALTQSSTFCMELLPDLATTLTFTKSMLYEDEHSLVEVIGQQLFELLAPLMLQRGIPTQALLKFKPWAAYMTLSTPPAQTGRVLDLILYEKARHGGKMLCGIETAEEQVAVFEQTPLGDQITLLQELASDPQAVDLQIQKMIPLYLQQDLAGLAALTTTEPEAEAKAFLKRLLDERNQRMLERILPLLGKKTAFVAVGALHLPGQMGLLQLLTEHGYNVSPLY